MGAVCVAMTVLASVVAKTVIFTRNLHPMFSSFRQQCLVAYVVWPDSWVILMVVFFFWKKPVVFDREMIAGRFPERPALTTGDAPSFDEMLLPILHSVEPKRAGLQTPICRLLHDLRSEAHDTSHRVTAMSSWAYTTGNRDRC